MKEKKDSSNFIPKLRKKNRKESLEIFVNSSTTTVKKNYGTKMKGGGRTRIYHSKTDVGIRNTSKKGNNKDLHLAEKREAMVLCNEHIKLYYGLISSFLMSKQSIRTAPHMIFI